MSHTSSCRYPWVELAAFSPCWSHHPVATFCAQSAHVIAGCNVVYCSVPVSNAVQIKLKPLCSPPGCYLLFLLPHTLRYLLSSPPQSLSLPGACRCDRRSIVTFRFLLRLRVAIIRGYICAYFSTMYKPQDEKNLTGRRRANLVSAFEAARPPAARVAVIPEAMLI